MAFPEGGKRPMAVACPDWHAKLREPKQVKRQSLPKKAMPGHRHSRNRRIKFCLPLKPFPP